MIQFRAVFVASLCLLGSCALFSDGSSDSRDQPVMDDRIDNSLLQHVSDDERAQVAETRQVANETRDAHAAAKADTSKAKDRRDLAGRELAIAEAELERAEAARQIAESGTHEELDHAKQGVSDAKSLVASVRCRIALRDRQVERASAAEDLKMKDNELAQAKVEAAKAHAVKELDRPQSKSIHLEAFEHQVRQCQVEVKIAEARVDAADEEVDAARATYDDSVKAVPANFRKDWPSEEDERHDD